MQFALILEKAVHTANPYRMVVLEVDRNGGKTVYDIVEAELDEIQEWITGNYGNLIYALAPNGELDCGGELTALEAAKAYAGL